MCRARDTYGENSAEHRVVDEDSQDSEDGRMEGADALIEELFEEIASVRMQVSSINHKTSQTHDTERCNSYSTPMCVLP